MGSREKGERTHRGRRRWGPGGFWGRPPWTPAMGLQGEHRGLGLEGAQCRLGRGQDSAHDPNGTWMVCTSG